MLSRVTTMTAGLLTCGSDALTGLPKHHTKRSVAYAEELTAYSCGGSPGLDMKCRTVFPFHRQGMLGGTVSC